MCVSNAMTAAAMTVNARTATASAASVASKLQLLLDCTSPSQELLNEHVPLSYVTVLKRSAISCV